MYQQKYDLIGRIPSLNVFVQKENRARRYPQDLPGKGEVLEGLNEVFLFSRFGEAFWAQAPSLVAARASLPFASVGFGHPNFPHTF
jgi:hypothetical protein